MDRERDITQSICVPEERALPALSMISSRSRRMIRMVLASSSLAATTLEIASCCRPAAAMLTSCFETVEAPPWRASRQGLLW